ncbi:ABC transporter ATP-binding protein [Hutsoniella sourekii]|uniref:ABC transporter ATP-binding protein n=1 Tax=Hutsoniella sourekii TaxID=87650 RepID=UPI0004807EFF|nr:ABC transporter ATP-binding protein [Hutsoniella sourekii]
METVLKIEQLSKSYGDHLALDDFSLDVKRGDIVGLAGPNGAGKTTLFKIITGLIPDYQGEFSYFGSVIQSERQANCQALGTIIEAPAIYPDMTVFQNINYYRIQRGIPEIDRVDELIELVGLKEQSNRKAKQLSLGMKQRLGIAISLIHRPEILIYDEPTNGLDPSGIIKVRELLLKLAREKRLTILVSSHILSELELLASRFVIINKGQKVREFTRDQLEEEIKSYIRVDADESARLATLLEEAFQTNDYLVDETGKIRIYDLSIDMAELNKQAVTRGIAIRELTYHQVHLEELYRELTEGGMDRA